MEGNRHGKWSFAPLGLFLWLWLGVIFVGGRHVVLVHRLFFEYDHLFFIDVLKNHFLAFQLFHILIGFVFAVKCPRARDQDSNGTEVAGIVTLGLTLVQGFRGEFRWEWFLLPPFYFLLRDHFERTPVFLTSEVTTRWFISPGWTLKILGVWGVATTAILLEIGGRIGHLLPLPLLSRLVLFEISLIGFYFSGGVIFFFLVDKGYRAMGVPLGRWILRILVAGFLFLVVSRMQNSLFEYEFLTFSLGEISLYSALLITLSILALKRDFLAGGDLFRDLTPVLGLIAVVLMLLPDDAQWDMLTHKLRVLILSLGGVLLILRFIPPGIPIRWGMPLPFFPAFCLGMIFLLRGDPGLRYWIHEILWSPALLLSPVESMKPLDFAWNGIREPLAANLARGGHQKIMKKSAAPASGMNHLWLMIDALPPLTSLERRDRFPAFFRLGDSGLHFQGHRGNCNATLPSLYNLLTGSFAFGMDLDMGYYPIRHPLGQFIEMAGFNRVYLPVAGPAFDFLDPTRVKVDFLIKSVPESGLSDHGVFSAAGVFPALHRALETPASGTRFILAYVNDLHAPRTRNRRGYDFGSTLHAIYLNNLSAIDGYLGELLDFLRDRGLEGNTVINLFGDHGEAFYQHNHNLHGFHLFEESQRTCWVLRFPGGPQGVVSRDSYTIDLLPTILGFEGYTAVKGFPGVDFSVAKNATLEREWVPLQSAFSHHLGLIYRGRYKLIWNFSERTFFWFDLVADPLEQRPQFECPLFWRESLAKFLGMKIIF